MASIADVYVTVLPETGKIAAGIKKALQDADDDVKAAARRWKKEIDDAFKNIKVDVDTKQAEKKIDDVEKKKPKVTVEVEADAAQVDKAVDKAVSKKKPKVKVEPEIEKSAMDRLEDDADALFKRMKVDLDETAKRNMFNKLRGDVEKSISNVGVKLNEQQVRTQLRHLTSELERLFGADNKINFEFDPARGLGNMRALFGDFSGKLGDGMYDAFKKTADKIKDVEVDVDVRTRTAERQISKLQKKAEGIFDDIGLGLDVDIAYTEIFRLRQQAEDILSGLNVDLDTSKAHTQLLGLEKVIETQHPEVKFDIGYDRDTLERTAVQVSTILSNAATEGIAEVGKTTGQFIFETLEKVARVHPLLTIGVVVTGAAAVVELTGVVASLTGVLGLIPGAAFAGVAAFGALKLATMDFMTVMEDMADPEKFAVGLRTLAPNAQQAALSIQAIMANAIQPLKGALSEELFADIGPQLISTVNAILPAITPGLTAIAGAFNSMITSVMAVFQDPEMIGLVSQMMNDIGIAFQALAPALGLFVEALIRMGTEGATYLPAIFQGITDAATKFNEFIASAIASGEFQQWVDLALSTLQEIWPLVPSIVDAFMGLVPIAQAILPELVASLQLLLAAIEPLSYILMVLGPNFSTMAILMGPIAGIADTISNALSVLGQIMDGLTGKPNALSSAFQQHFPMLAGIVQSAAGAIQAALQLITNAIDDVLRRIQGLIDNPAVRFLLPGLTMGLNIIGPPGSPAPSGPPGAPAPGTPGVPPSTGPGPGETVPAGTPGAVVRPGTNQWMMPGVAVPRSGGREPGTEQRPGQFVPPTPTNPYNLPSGNIPLPPLPPPTASGGGGGGGGGGAPEPVSPVPGAPYTYGGFGELNWDALAEKESGGNWSMNTGNGFYGGLQFVQGTWERYGGLQFAERADLADKKDQIKVATAAYNAEGPAPWPTWGHLLTATDDELRSAGLTAAGNTRSGGPRSSSYGGIPGGGGGYGPGGGGGPGGRGGGGAAGALRQFALSQEGEPYGWGGEGHGSTLQSGAKASSTAGLYDCSGFMSDLYAIVTGQPYQGDERYFTTESNFESLGFTRGYKAGAFNIGVNTSSAGAYGPGAHTAGQLPTGENVESTGGGVKVGPEAKDPRTFANQYHIDVAGGDYGAADYSYDGPGGGPNDPMYTTSKGTGGEQLGKDIFTGIGEIFGLGELFKDPTQFGLFKIMKGLTEFGLGLAKSRGGQDNGYGNGSGGGGGGGGLVDSLMGLIPQPYGDLNNGTPTDAPLEFIPGVSQGGGGTLPNFMAGFVPPGQPGQVDASTNLNIVNPQYGRQDPVMAEVDEFLMRDTRQGLRNVPTP